MYKLKLAIFHNLHSGGAKRVTAEHLKRLSERHDVTLYSLSTADHRFAQASERQAYAAVLASFRPHPWLPSPFGRLNTLVGMRNVALADRLARAIAARIDAAGFDVVLAHPCQLTQAPLVLRWLRTPALYYCHELPRSLYEPPARRQALQRSALRTLVDTVDPLPTLCRAYYRRVDRVAAQRASRIAVNSHVTQARVRSAYGRPADVCWPGVDGVSFQPGARRRERFVLSVGALTPLKGFDFLIDALGTLPAAGRPGLVLVSNYQEPDEASYLTARAQSRGVSLNIQVGASEDQLQDWYARAGCVAYAPIKEPFGLVALEAMAAAAPLVCVAEGGPAEIVAHGVTGLLAPRDAVTFGRAVGSLLDDPRLGAQLGRAAARAARTTWSWERHMGELELLLVQTAGHAGGSSRDVARDGLSPNP